MLTRQATTPVNTEIRAFPLFHPQPCTFPNYYYEKNALANQFVFSLPVTRSCQSIQDWPHVGGEQYSPLCGRLQFLLRPVPFVGK